jgi:hypothetical protein
MVIERLTVFVDTKKKEEGVEQCFCFVINEQTVPQGVSAQVVAFLIQNMEEKSISMICKAPKDLGSMQRLAYTLACDTAHHIMLSGEIKKVHLEDITPLV